MQLSLIIANLWQLQLDEFVIVGFGSAAPVAISGKQIVNSPATSRAGAHAPAAVKELTDFIATAERRCGGIVFGCKNAIVLHIKSNALHLGNFCI